MTFSKRDSFISALVEIDFLTDEFSFILVLYYFESHVNECAFLLEERFRAKVLNVAATNEGQEERTDVWELTSPTTYFFSFSFFPDFSRNHFRDENHSA